MQHHPHLVSCSNESNSVVEKNSPKKIWDLQIAKMQPLSYSTKELTMPAKTSRLKHKKSADRISARFK